MLSKLFPYHREVPRIGKKIKDFPGIPKDQGVTSQESSQNWIIHALRVVLNYGLLKDRCLIEITINNILLCYHIKEIDSMLPIAWTVTGHRRRQKCRKHISDKLCLTSCSTFLFLSHFLHHPKCATEQIQSNTENTAFGIQGYCPVTFELLFVFLEITCTIKSRDNQLQLKEIT